MQTDPPRPRLLLLGLCCLMCGPLYAIEGTIGSTIGFRQRFNLYSWQYQLNSRRAYHNRWLLSFSEQFRSSMLQLGSVEDKWKDDQNLQLLCRYKLLPSLTLISDLTSIIFQDNKSGFDNDIRTN